jgi:hypothetical protein
MIPQHVPRPRLPFRVGSKCVSITYDALVHRQARCGFRRQLQPYR